MKKIYKLSAIVLVSLMGVEVVSVQVANATTVSNVRDEQVGRSEVIDNGPSLNSQQIDDLDKYVEVKNNQFVLSLDAATKFSNEEIQEAQVRLDSTNKMINEKHMLIDPETKTAEQISPFISFAKYNKHYTYATKWFGGRYYFTSNAAVEELAYKFRNHSSVLQVLGVIPGLAGAIGNLGSAYFNKIANDLENYNNKHKHNQIYMDLNWNGTYSFHILK